MERADRLAVLDPAAPHRPPRVGAAAEQRMISLALAKDRDPQAVDLDGEGSPILHLVRPADLDEPSHAGDLPDRGHDLGGQTALVALGRFGPPGGLVSFEPGARLAARNQSIASTTTSFKL